MGEEIASDMPRVFTGAVRGEFIKIFCLDLKVVSELLGTSLEPPVSAILIASLAESTSRFGEIFVDNTEFISELFKFFCKICMSGEG